MRCLAFGLFSLLLFLGMPTTVSGEPGTPMLNSGTVDSLEWRDPMACDTSMLQGGVDYALSDAPYLRIPHKWLDAKFGHEGEVASGLSVEFYSASPRMVVEVVYSRSHDLPSLPKLQLDLYSTDCHGSTVFVPCADYANHDRTMTVGYDNLTYQNTHRFGNRYRLYLPSGVTIESVRIGTCQGTPFEWVPPRLETPIIVSGVFANDRQSPSDALAPFVQKTLDYSTVDLTVSTPLALDSLLIAQISDRKARLYILGFTDKKECGMTTDQIIRRVRQMRERTETPILLAEGTSSTKSSLQAQREAYRRLVEEGIKSLYYSTGDYIIPDIVSALNIKTDWVCAPITQARDMASYTWEKRHNQVIERNRTSDPEVLVIGNSIMNYWSGRPAAKHHRGDDSWSSLFGQRRVTNMGFGWDRIENLNWRIMHGELDDCAPSHIFLMIGTNNISVHDPVEHIAQGIVETVGLIRTKQPQAKLHLMTLTPRRGQEAIVREVNRRVGDLLKGNKEVDYINIYDVLTIPNSGGVINEALFRDGLHPNAEGYRLIADRISEAVGKL